MSVNEWLKFSCKKPSILLCWYKYWVFKVTLIYNYLRVRHPPRLKQEVTSPNLSSAKVCRLWAFQGDSWYLYWLDLTGNFGGRERYEIMILAHRRPPQSTPCGALTDNLDENLNNIFQMKFRSFEISRSDCKSYKAMILVGGNRITV